MQPIDVARCIVREPGWKPRALQHRRFDGTAESPAPYQATRAPPLSARLVPDNPIARGGNREIQGEAGSDRAGF